MCLQLTNGDVMCHQYGTNRWHRLRPDAAGVYKTGTWDTPPIAPMPNSSDGNTYSPLFFTSAVLKDGRVLVMGGEYNNGGKPFTNIGFIYDPVTDKWSKQLTSAFPSGSVGDSMGVNLADGTFAMQNINTRDLQVLNPSTGVFTAKNSTGKLDVNDEEGLYPLYDGTVLTVDASTASSWELYNTTSNSWTNGAMPVNLADIGAGVGKTSEVGPCALRPDGKLVCFSGNSLGQNAIFDTSNNTWSHTTSMDFPTASGGGHYSVNDGPGASLPNGNVLVMSSPVTNTSPNQKGARYYEMNLSDNTLSRVSDPASAAASTSVTSYQGRMLVLPTGQVLLTTFDQSLTSDEELYTPTGGPQASYRPTITNAPTTITGGSTHTIKGKMFNGFSYGATYGDDSQSASNYPLVRLTNLASHHVFYGRTFNFSSMAVEKVGSGTIVTASFETPQNIEAGATTLEVVANGIASTGQTVTATTGPCYQGAPGELHFVDPAKGKDDLEHGGDFGACAYKTLTYALAHATGQIALQTATYTSATETFPIVLNGIQQLLCQYTTSAPATIKGMGASPLIGGQSATVIYNGVQNEVLQCIIDGGGAFGSGVFVNTDGNPFPQQHYVIQSDISHCGSAGVTVGNSVDNVVIVESIIHDNALGVFWQSNNNGYARMDNNVFSTNAAEDLLCGTSDSGVVGSGNSGSTNGKPSCFTCAACPF